MMIDGIAYNKNIKYWLAFEKNIGDCNTQTYTIIVNNNGTNRTAKVSLSIYFFSLVTIIIELLLK